MKKKENNFIKNNFFKKFSEFFTGSFLSSLLSIVSIPIMTRLISPEIFGEFSLFLLIYNILCLVLTLGLEHSFLRYYSEYQEENKKYFLKKILQVVLYLNIAIIFLFKIFSEKIVTILNFKNEKVLDLLLIGIMVAIINKFAIIYLRILQKGKLYSILLILYQILNIGLVLVLTKFLSKEVTSLIYPMIISNMVITLIALTSNYKYWIGVLKIRGDIEVINLKEILNYSYPILLSSLIIWGYQSLDKVMLKEYSNFKELGLYTVSFRVVGILNIIQQPFNAMWIPLVLEKKNELDNMFLKKINEVITVTVFLLGGIAIVFSPLIILVLGASYDGIQKIYPFLVFVPLLNIMSEVVGVGIIITKKTKYQTIISCMALILNYLLNYILIPLYGALGAAISSLFSYYVCYILKWWISNKIFHIKFKILKVQLNLFLLLVLAVLTYSYNKLSINICFYMTAICLNYLIYFYEKKW